MTDVLKIENLQAYFPHKIDLNSGCRGQHELHTSSINELVHIVFSKPEQLLGKVKGLQLLTAKHHDKCCGFGGTFCVTEEAVYIKMDRDRIKE